MTHALARARRRLSGRALILVVLAVVVAAALVVVGREAWARQAARPNVLLIVADDMRHDTLWAMPTVMELAGRGVSFSRAYVTTPLCCPSRATILNGQYARHHGVKANERPLGGVEAFDDRSTLATWLQGAGVRTGLVGRHLNEYQSLTIPPGWDYWFAILQQGESNSLYQRYYVNNNGQDEFYGSRGMDYSTRILGRRALQMLAQDTQRPFMLMFTPRAPHAPALPDQRDAGSFRTVELPPLPPSFDEADVADKPGPIRALARLTDTDRERIDAFRRRQLETLVGLDREIAAIIEALRADGRLDATWIIFTSDNGLTLGEHRLAQGKSCAYEECVRVPLVVVPPGGLAQGRTDDRLVANIDLAPTIAEIMRATPDGPVDGRSLLPLLQGRAVDWRDALVLEQWTNPLGEAFVAIRTPDRKYVRRENGEDELYDWQADAFELENRAHDPSRADEKRQLSERLDALLQTPAGEQPPAQR